MFRPVSIQLIRQALAWQGIKPVKVECTSTFKWPDGSTHGYYVISLDGAWVRSHTGYGALWDGSDADRQIRQEVQSCFCADGYVARSWFNVNADLLQIQLLMKVSARDPMVE